MKIRINYLPALIIFTVLAGSGASTALGQSSVAEFQKVLREKAAFDQTDFAALEREQRVVRLAPVADKREVAVSGLVNVRAGADDFLNSYRESMVRKSNAAILGIGKFGKEPSLGDLQNLTIESRDIEDLKECVVGDCPVKLSAPMIERFQKEINWQSSDYQANASNLFKQMLLEYVRDYRARGEAALIEYHDKRDEIRLAAEQRGLSSAS